MKRTEPAGYTRHKSYDVIVVFTANGVTSTYTPCYYCGEVGTDDEHVLPVIAADSVEMRHLRILVPSCSECNAIAGALIDQTLKDRRKRVKDGLRRKYKKLLSAPVWTSEELDALEPGLRGWIVNQNTHCQLIRARIAYYGKGTGNT